MKHIAITGVPGAGKSTMAQAYLAYLGLEYRGFCTKVEQITPYGPTYVMEEISSGRRQPISRVEEGQIRGIPETFDGFGAEVLENAIHSDAPIILLDEIGRFERNSDGFLSAVDAAFGSAHRVLAILKKEPLPYIEAVKARKDTLVLDLDELGRALAWERLIEEGKRWTS